ncbi:MAG: molybdenum ABC transporter ATP-binding protein [Acidobacteria bacterium]|nr:MAG: molybdenum ABC transporter ATP-binding protein [Acidobacteriota bacterium]
MDAVGGEVNATMLAARIRKERRSADASSFVLDVSIEVSPGITILFGASGAGKSTLLDCVAGLARPDEGQIAAGGEVLFDSARGIHVPTPKRRTAYVFQTLALFPHLSAEENVAYGLTDLREEERREQVEAILKAFRVEKLRKQRPNKISGGERQRIALARSLVTEPRVLLLDEPLTGLDAELKASIVDDLRAWNAAKGIPILYVTHSREEVDALGERVIALDNGRVASTGRPMDVLDAPRRKKLAQAAGFENLLSATVLDLREADGVMRVKLGDSACEIEVPLGYAAAGSRVRVAVRAGDILLATEPPRGLSARNVLDGRIVSLEQRGTMAMARVDCGIAFIVHVTPGAVRALELTAGRRVWLVLKTHSCHLVE